MNPSLGDVTDLGPESLLGFDAEGQHAQDVRDRLALATRYLASWYKATKGSERQAMWWQRIDDEREKIERAYSLACADGNETFLNLPARAAYVDAAETWPALWRDLKLSADTLPEPSLIDAVAGIASAPFAMLPTLSNEFGKALGDSLGNLGRRLFPWLLVGAAAWGVYTFREPLTRALNKAAA